jgi:hypothetical protein
MNFWKEFALGMLCGWPIVWLLMRLGWWPSTSRKNKR